MPPAKATKTSNEVAGTPSANRGGPRKPPAASSAAALQKEKERADKEREMLEKQQQLNQPPATMTAGEAMNFDTLPLESLRKYKSLHKLQAPSALTLNGYLLSGPMGKKTWSYKHRTRVNKPELAAAAKKHFMAQPVRESEIIVDFVYAVKNHDKAFKLQFNP
ncbi:Transcriptional regulatory protein [Yarrowia sp. C11]|nr:Transcriptional regulatory protein [Yarrowia sp. C11]KAG5364146.1 Transcriptional regulatory protein [Yarrowia sp. E02]